MPKHTCHQFNIVHLYYLGDLQRAAVHVGLDRGNIENGNGHLGVRRLGSELVVGIPESLPDGVDTNEGAGGQEVLALQAAGAHGVLLRPDAVGVLREELTGSELVARVASRGGLGVSKVGGARGALESLGRILHGGLTSRARPCRATGRGGIIGCGGQGGSSLKSLVTTRKQIGL